MKCLITGASSGIGKGIVIELAQKGNEIIVFGRDSIKTRDAITEVKAIVPSAGIELICVDLSDLRLIRAACEAVIEKHESIDLLINNAGVYKRKKEVIGNGIEMTLAVNYLAPFLISRLLKDVLSKGQNPLILNITSAMYFKGVIPDSFPTSISQYKGNRVYADSKLLLLLDSLYLADELKSAGVRVNCAHPGVVGTDVFREYPRWFNRILNLFITKPDKSAKAMCDLAISEEFRDVSGEYFNIRKREVIKNGSALRELYVEYESLVQQFLKKN